MARYPRLDPDHQESVMFGVKLSHSDADELTEQARRAGMSKSAFIRIAVLVALATRESTGPPGEDGQPQPTE